MADFDFTLDIDSIFPKGIADQNLVLDMVKSGQEVMQKAIQSGASKHKRTGHMAASLRCTKPVINKNGDAVGRVKFSGSDGVVKSKKGNRFDRTNWIKAFRIEYGTKHQRAQPFVRPAIKGAESSIRTAMERVFNQKMKG